MVAANSRIREALTLRARVSIEVCHLTGFKHVFFRKRGGISEELPRKKTWEKRYLTHLLLGPERWRKMHGRNASLHIFNIPFWRLEHNSVRQRTEMVFLVALSWQNRQLTVTLLCTVFCAFFLCVFFSKLNASVFCCPLQQCLIVTVRPSPFHRRFDGARVFRRSDGFKTEIQNWDSFRLVKGIFKSALTFLSSTLCVWLLWYRPFFFFKLQHCSNKMPCGDDLWIWNSPGIALGIEHRGHWTSQGRHNKKRSKKSAACLPCVWGWSKSRGDNTKSQV